MTKTNPFIVTATRAEPIENILNIKVDREDEIQTCGDALVGRRHNVLLYGSRGVGKTFMVRLLQHEIENNYDSIFPVIVTLSGLPAYGQSDLSAAFSRAVLLQICAKAWTKLLNKPYLDLRERLNEHESEITLRSGPEKTIQRIYSLLMEAERRVMFESVGSVGVNFGVRAEVNEKDIFERRQADVLPFEFAEFADELLNKTFNKFKKERIIVFCDEANTLPIFDQEDILQRYLDLFAAKKVQFLFVAGYVKLENIQNLPQCFETRLELKGFSKIDHVRELLDKINSPKRIDIANEALEIVYDHFGGHPRLTLSVCYEAVKQANEAKQTIITGPIMESVCKEYIIY